ncbi:hypothetical protein [Mycobacterium sp. GA-1841]|uniref:hypothetical protein n=1 Tax=Mycobacterium sp. GA-1841 TaxID=1834154 RepID=UPI00111549CA|nr:hypothetical protein [Mycobacterium sp. GA-1841]
MTALQDWLTIPTSASRTMASRMMAPRTIRALVRAPLRIALPGRPVPADREPRLLNPGVERC